MERRWIKFATLAAVWAFIGLLLAIEVYFNFRASMKGEAISFWEVGLPQFVRAVMWGLMAPWILAAREKMPLSRGYWVGGVSFHLFFAFLVMATFYLGRIFFGDLDSP